VTRAAYSWGCLRAIGILMKRSGDRNKFCIENGSYTSVRKGSFFEGFNIKISMIMKIMIKKACREQLTTINNLFPQRKRTILRIINKFNTLIPNVDFSDYKLGGPGVIIQVDETLLSYECKIHRGRPAHNKTDCVCIVEVGNGIERAYATVIPNKERSTLVPLILRNVSLGSVIWTDDSR